MAENFFSVIGGGSHRPSWTGEAGCASKEKIAQQPHWRRRGGCSSSMKKSNPCSLLLIHHPVCANKGASQLFLDRAATPPGQEGRWSRRLLQREEVIPFVVDDDEGRKVLNLNLPDRFHAEVFILDDLDLLDTVLRKIRRGAADGPQIKTTIRLTGRTHVATAVPLGQHDVAATGLLELVDVGIHASRSGGPERS